MSRRHRAVKREVIPDPKFKDVVVSKFMSCLMFDGKRSLAESIVYGAFEQIESKSGNEPVKVFHDALENVRPHLEVRSRRVGGATYQVPVEVCSNRGTRIALFWILRSARKRPEPNIAQQLSAELLDAIRRIGNSIRKREEIHRIAEANKAFTRYRF